MAGRAFANLEGTKRERGEMKMRIWLLTACASFLLSGFSAEAANDSSTTRAGASKSETRGPHEDALIEVLRQYIRGCNAGDLELLKSTFTEDIKVYFIELPPVMGREAVAKFWVDYHDATHARWTIDHVVVEGNEAVFEWSSLEVPKGASAPVFTRGVDWYVFRGNQIAEIRQYYDVRNVLPADRSFELEGFPYKERNYPLRDNLDTRLP